MHQRNYSITRQQTQTPNPKTQQPPPQKNSPQGWFAKIKISDASQLEGLMGEDAYAEFCANEEH